MLKKLFVAAAAAAAVSVPLAGVAGADPAPDNPGLPGNIGGRSPGSVISQAAQQPGSVPDVVSEITDGYQRTPGEAVKSVAPGRTP